MLQADASCCPHHPRLPKEAILVILPGNPEEQEIIPCPRTQNLEEKLPSAAASPSNTCEWREPGSKRQELGFLQHFISIYWNTLPTHTIPEPKLSFWDTSLGKSCVSFCAKISVFSFLLQFPEQWESSSSLQAPLPPHRSLCRIPAVFLPAAQSQALSRKATRVQRHFSSEPQQFEGRTLLSELPAQLRGRAECSLTPVQPLINTLRQANLITSNIQMNCKYTLPLQDPWGIPLQRAVCSSLCSSSLPGTTKHFHSSRKRKLSFTSSKRSKRDKRRALHAAPGPQHHPPHPWAPNTTQTPEF